MTRWQKRARLALAAVALAVVAIVALTLRERHPQPASRGVARIDPAAVAESVGGRMVQASGTRVPGVVDFEWMAGYADGTAKLIGPKISTDRGGRQFVVTAREAKVGKDQAHVALTGSVKLTSSDGLIANADDATYERAAGLVRAPGRVTFAKGALTGTSVGMTYDEEQDVLSLLDQVRVKVAAGTTTGTGADIEAGGGVYSRPDKRMDFERRVRIMRAGRTVSADSARAFLAEDESHLERLELRANSQIATPDAAEGGLQSMAARDMDLTYGADGETLQRALLTGGGSIVMAGAAGAAGRRIGGERIDITFSPEGELSALSARERVQLTMPAQKDTPERVISATAMQGSGPPGGGLTSARFGGGVEFRESPPGGPPRIARARALELSMAPATGIVEEARFTGDTRFEESALRAAAADGRYLVGKGMLELSGSEGPRDPRVQTERITVDAKRIDLTFEGPVLIARGAVRSVVLPARDTGQPDAPATGAQASGSAGTTENRTVPGMLKDDQPVYVTGATLDYDGGRSFATYRGGSRLWQGTDTVIQGETIVLDEHSGDLKASGSVRSTFVLEQVDQKTQQPTKVPSIATSKDLHYEDALRRAAYTTDAHVTGPQGDCHADRIELYFLEGGGSLERAEAYRAVKLVTDARTSTGDRMTYFAADERYVMVGAPVRVVEECRETTAKTLTFWRSTDRILADGNEEIRTLTKKGGTCAEPRPQ
jgi:LPS export ABC transporter protein LptC